MQVQRLAGDFTQSFMDYQRLSKVVPESTEVFEQLQQAANLCLGSRHHMRQVIHGDMCYARLYALTYTNFICLPELVAVAGEQGKTIFSFWQQYTGYVSCLLSNGLAALLHSIQQYGVCSSLSM